MIINSFTLRVLIVSFLCLAFPLLIDSFIFFQSLYNEAIVDAKKDMKSEANFRNLGLSSFQPVSQTFLSEISYMMNLSSALDTSKPDANLMNRELMKVVHVGGDFQMYVLGIQNEHPYPIIASSNPDLVGSGFMSHGLLESVKELGEVDFIRYLYVPAQEKYVPHIFTAQLVHSKSTQKPVGIIMAVANIENKLDELVKISPRHPEFLFALINADNIVFDATDPKLKGHYFGELSDVRRQEILTKEKIGVETLPDEPLTILKKDPPFFEFIFNDQVQVAYWTDAVLGKMSLMVYSPKESFFGGAVLHFFFLYTVYGLILIAGAGVTYWISRFLSRPLRHLSYVMRQVSHGKLDARFKSERLGFEINLLGALFNQTMDNLLKQMQKAEDERVKKETYQRELSIIREVQQSLFPFKVPVLEGAEFAGGYLPASDVGGDYYGYIMKQTKEGEEAVIFNLVDVAGVGISSCLYALSLRGLIRTYATLNDDVGAILTLANRAFYGESEHANVAVTIFLGMYHVESRLFSYCNCGHNPCFVKRANGEIISLDIEQIALGLDGATVYHTHSLKLFEGDMVILFTEGLIEAKNDNHELYGVERLKTLCRESNWESAQSGVDGIAQAVQEHTGEAPQEKEIIVVTLSVARNEA